MNLESEHGDVLRMDLQGSSPWRCRALSMCRGAAQHIWDARHSMCQMFRSDSFSPFCPCPLQMHLKSNLAGDKVSWIRHRDGSDLNLLTVNDLVYTQVRSESTVGCSAKRLFLSSFLSSTYMVPLGDWSPQKKFQHYRPINGLGMAIWSFDLIYNVKTAEIGAKIFKINKMAKNHFSR